MRIPASSTIPSGLRGAPCAGLKLAKGLPVKEGVEPIDRLDEVKIGRYDHMPEDKPLGRPVVRWKTFNTAQVLYREADIHWLDEPDASLDAST